MPAGSLTKQSPQTISRTLTAFGNKSPPWSITGTFWRDQAAQTAELQLRRHATQRWQTSLPIRNGNAALAGDRATEAG